MNWKERQSIIDQAFSQTPEGGDRYWGLLFLKHGVDNMLNGRYPASFRTHTANILFGNRAVDDAYSRLDQEFKRLFPESEL